MEKSYLPQWFIDLSTLTGVVGFTITIVGFIFTYIIFNQVKELKFKYLSKQGSLSLMRIYLKAPQKY
jgi:hypothetical protein